VQAWLEQYRDVWEASFQRLDALLAELQREPGPSNRTRKKIKR
jgi:hypothetical protein